MRTLHRLNCAIAMELSHFQQQKHLILEHIPLGPLFLCLIKIFLKSFLKTWLKRDLCNFRLWAGVTIP